MNERVYKELLRLPDGFFLKYVSIDSANFRPSARSMFIFQLPATIFFLIEFSVFKCIVVSLISINELTNISFQFKPYSFYKRNLSTIQGVLLIMPQSKR